MENRIHPSAAFKKHLNISDRHYPRVKGWKKISQANEFKNQVDVAILILNRINFKLKLIERDGEGHFTLKEKKSTKMTFQF